MKLHGETPSNPLMDGYIPGAWDEIRDAYSDGVISEEAYTLVRDALMERQEAIEILKPQWRHIPSCLPEASVDAYRMGRNTVIDKLRTILKIEDKDIA